MDEHARTQDDSAPGGTAAPPRRTPWLGRMIASLAALAVLAAALTAPAATLSATRFVLESLIAVGPLVGAGILLAAWVTASGASDHVAALFGGAPVRAVAAAAVIGAVTPVCGVTVLPLMAGLLATGVPLAPVMAFWLSSPVTDPAMLAATAAVLGPDFALGKTIAAFALGLLGGGATAVFARSDWSRRPLRAGALVDRIARPACGGPAGFRAAFWRERRRRRLFAAQLRGLTKLILICLIPAFAAEYALNAALDPAAVSAYVGRAAWWAVPAAVFVGGPVYIDGFAALPLVRALLDNGMAPGAALAFLVSGGVVSVWGAMAIAPVLRLKPFLLYLTVALTGSMAAGWLYGWVV